MMSNANPRIDSAGVAISINRFTVNLSTNLTKGPTAKIPDAISINSTPEIEYTVRINSQELELEEGGGGTGI